MGKLSRIAMVAFLALFAFGVQAGTLLAQENVVGTTYTSPHYDYQVQWGSPWYFVMEGSEGGADYVVISDGGAYVQFTFDFVPIGDARFMVDVLTSSEDPSGYLTNIQPLLDAQGVAVEGGDMNRAWGGITGTHTLDDGSTVEMIVYYDVRVLPGGVIAIMTATAPSYYYDDTILLGWQELASTALILPETTTTAPTAEPTTVPEPTVTEEPTTAPPPVETVVPETPTLVPPATVEGGVGEPAPAFAVGPWRVAVRAVDQGEAIGYLGLEAVAGQRWVVVYADVTNWSGADAQLDVAGMTLVTANGPVAPDTAATQSAATLLGLQPSTGSSVQVPAGGSTRVALVYSIPAGEPELILEAQGEQLPLAAAVGRQLDVTDLSTIATPPAMITGTVGMVRIDDAGELELTVNTDNGTTTVALTGVELPTNAVCFDRATTLASAGELAGAQVWLEADPAVTEPNAFYVWYADAQGNRVMLNQTLIASGQAIGKELPADARFGAWLAQTGAVAQADGTGLWTVCAGQL